jgi:hypothetical protein
MPGSPSILQVTDDVPLYVGAVANGGLTNDPTPTVTISLAGTGLDVGDAVQLAAGGAALGGAHALTAEEVAAGRVDLVAPNLADGVVDLTAVAQAADGSAASSQPWALTIDTVGLGNHDVTAVYSDDGLVAKHSYTNDRTLVAETTLVTSGDFAVSAGDTVRFIVDGYYWGDPIVLTQADIDRGVLTVAAPELSYGDHWFRFDPIDQAGNSAGSANYWPFTVSERLAPQIVSVTDDVSPQTGEVPEQGFTNDTVLAVRASLADTLAQAGDTLVLSARGQSVEVTLTADDLARGYVDLDTPTLAMSSTGREGYTDLTAQIRYADGGVSPIEDYEIRLATRDPDAPAIVAASDDSGALAGGASTEDATPTFTLQVDTDPGAAWTPPPPPPSGSPGHPMPPPHFSATLGAPVTLFANGQAVGTAIVTDAELTITSAALQPGTYTFTAQAVDKAGNTSELSAPFVLTIAGAGDPPPSGEPGQDLASPGPGAALAGGAGADTLTASAGLDTLTGGGGADVFSLSTEPWAPIHITDFVLGTDKLDLSRLLQASGYAGADPIADGYLYIESDGGDGALLRYDRDAGGGDPQWPNTIVDLEHVSPAGLTWAQLQADGTGSPTPGDGGGSGEGQPEGGTGQALTSPGPGASLTGGAGADTLTASEGLDTLTGGAGADVFAFSREPWAPIHITDFTPGEDKLDLSALLRTAGYAGGDPVADGYVFIESDGAGGSYLRFDHDGGGPNPQWPNTIIDLEQVAPAQVSAADWIVR